MKRLALTYKGKTVVSDSFNMKAYAAMFEASKGGEAYHNAAMQGIAALFDGTEITPEAIESDWRNLDCAELEKATERVCAWYTGVAVDPALGAPRPAGGATVQPLVTGMYGYFFRKYGCLPSDTAMQDPQMLLDILAQDIKHGKLGNPDAPEHLKDLYEA